MNFSVSDIVWFLVVAFALAWVIVMSWAAHKQYMLGHNTWLFSHTTEEEKALREIKLEKLTKEQ